MKISFINFLEEVQLALKETYFGPNNCTFSNVNYTDYPDSYIPHGQLSQVDEYHNYFHGSESDIDPTLNQNEEFHYHQQADSEEEVNHYDAGSEEEYFGPEKRTIFRHRENMPIHALCPHNLHSGMSWT